MTACFLRYMRHGACVMLCATGAPLLAASYTSAAATFDSTVVAPDKFDYAVPDAPAFKLLEVDPNSILRPGTRREVAVAVENASLENFAVEFAPFLLARDGEIPRAEYRRKRQLYNLRISAGVRTPEGGPTGAGIGLRLSLFDAGDPYASPELLAAADAAGATIQDLRRQAQKQLMDSLQSAEAFAALPLETREQLIESRIGRHRRAAEQGFEEAREAFKNEWNRSILEVAFAVAGTGSDSSSQAIHATAYAAWLTGGKQLGTRGQLLVGGSGRIVPNKRTGALDSGEGSAALRFYYGSNVAKAACSLDGGWRKNAVPRLAGSLGTELRLIQTVWVNAGVGLKKEGSDPAEVTTDFSLRCGLAGVIPLPELLKSGGR